MAKKKKNRVPNLDKRDSLSSGERSDLYDAVRFELEEDAEQIFRDAIEKLSPGDIADKERQTRRAEAKKQTVGQQEGPRQVDLHGLTLGQAQSRVKQAIEERLVASSGEFNLRIVTGKGIHSGPTGGVLAREIHEFVRLRFKEYIVEMTDSPADVTLAGVPMRGYFDVKFRAHGRRK